jgi:hypothetical protein
MAMIRLFCGYDRREQVGYDVFRSSVHRRASTPVDFTKLDECGLGQRGTNAFTFSRFLVPHFCGYQGHAIFCDASDQVMLADVAELDALFDHRVAVQVVQHPTYSTRHRMKYVGTDMECPNVDYPRKNWASVMLINCEHPAWRVMLAGIDDMPIRDLLQLRWLGDLEIGALPDEWNRLVDEGQPVEGAKILHWTCGIPGFDHYKNAPGAEWWHAEAAVRT